ncbi:MAG: SCP2 sterol-binding domain-containing protein [Acidimicrobiia bacterium]
MVEFLSPEWVAALVEHAGDRGDVSGVSVEHVVPDAPSGPVRYRLILGGEGVRVDADPAGPADLTVETDFATAVRLHRGEWSAQDAATAGHLKLQGRISVLRDTRDLVDGLGDVFGALRTDTDMATPDA